MTFARRSLPCLLAVLVTALPARAAPHDPRNPPPAPIAHSGYGQPAPRFGRLQAGGTVMRTFRLAVSTTGAYTRAMGGTVEGAMAGVTRTVARLNEIYEPELGIHFELVANNKRLVNLPGKRDRFRKLTADLDIANYNGRFIRERIGDDAFDIGHVLDARGDAGVVGSIGTSCRPFYDGIDDPGRSNASGMSGSSAPMDDHFIVGVVAHELGHQLGAWHTFNGCMRSALEDGAVEPGGGSTIMGYAGRCSADGLQAHADPYFHAVSRAQIGDWLASRGGSCAAVSLNTTAAPWIEPESMASIVQVPARTAFRLGAEAMYADYRAGLTYGFEQVDTGPAQTRPFADIGVGPLFRSRPPTPTGEQTFPAMAVLLGKEPIGLGDTWPTTTRDLRFRLTVRDNIPGAAHAVTADRRVHVTDTGRPFAITSPMDTMTAGAPMPVTWDVAGTADEPILCSHVRVDLSLDGGMTFDAPPLLSNTPNQGHAMVRMPRELAGNMHARLRVMCGNDTFFAVSPRDITIL